jgi:ATP-dependent Clp protease protease subunit
MTVNQAKELDANTKYYIEILAKNTGKTQEEIRKDIQRPKYFRAQEAIDYGLADKIIESRGIAMEKRVRRYTVVFQPLFLFWVAGLVD